MELEIEENGNESADYKLEQLEEMLNNELNEAEKYGEEEQ